jgi:hypothetical protein
MASDTGRSCSSGEFAGVWADVFDCQQSALLISRQIWLVLLNEGIGLPLRLLFLLCGLTLEHGYTANQANATVQKERILMSASDQRTTSVVQ